MLRIDQLQEIVHVLVKHGILEDGIKRQVDERGCLTLRMPGMKKENREDNMSFEELAEIGKKPKPVDETEDSLYHIGGPIGKVANFFDNLL